MSLKLCNTCNGRGIRQRSHVVYEGPCPVCEGSGFENATAAQAWEMEKLEAKGYNEESRRRLLSVLRGADA